jgi:C-terminal processing protease CtpA/Prc
MLDVVSSDVHKYYFDSKLHGLDWDALVRETKANITKTPNIFVANAEIVALLERLDDSHTFFVPPRNTITVDYGWQFKIVGNHCYVVGVNAGSDAERKGMRPGDDVLTIDGFTVDRASVWKLGYAMNVLMPLTSIALDLRDPAGKNFHSDVASDVRKHKVIMGMDNGGRDTAEQRRALEDDWRRIRAQYKEFGPELMILRIPAFVQTDIVVDNLIKKARDHKTLIVDLRGTPGGLEASVMDYLGDLFDHDLKIGDRVGRDKTKPLMVKSNRHNAFTSNLIVLVDSETASAGEIFARAVQIEKRGTILGDQSSGKTMEANHYPHSTGNNPVYFYGTSVTVADIVMADGKSLEHIGVVPDKIMLPTAADIAAGRDTVLAQAAEMAGVKLTPEDAAKLFPRETPHE